MEEVLKLIARLQELRPDLVVVPRELSKEMDFQFYYAYMNTQEIEEKAAAQARAELGGQISWTSTAVQTGWTAAIEQFDREGGVAALTAQ